MKQKDVQMQPVHRKTLRSLYVIGLIIMAFTGFGQMPLYKRYYISDIPGLSWAADFFVTHYIHYLGAMFLLGLFAYLVLDFLLTGSKTRRLTRSAWIRIVLMGGIVFTGVFRVLKNMQDVSFSPGFTFFIDIAHIGFMMFYLMAALVFLILKTGWLVEKS